MTVDNWISVCRKQAAEVRKDFGISLFSPIEVMKIYHESKINVIIEPIESDISGFFLRKGSSELVFINSARSKGHQVFTAAHEFYHIKFDPDLPGRACSVGKFDKRSQSEFKADMFAAYLLAPDEAIHHHIHRLGQDAGNLNYNDVIELEQHFGISHQTMMNRLRQMELLTPDQIDRYRSGVIDRALRSGFDVSLYKPTNERKIISEYAEKALKALERELISEGKYEELLLEGGFADIIFGEENEEGDLL
ncbi:ImmA/IrrE family metallo-endopeptidase [Paenibacillus alkaliterrae]|uniref:ImmA/IrrE family metallo-endopeptidase n=1 Tax=Paenibacillus alkaliterrae TaxID=320909 RepID=UPI001F41B9D3|nr:ImmA/IrrE family metallo-endopeptidase [Paenibacillus alkaliterrae]MCF2939783.1 ImmA/IrrE family metallo-endopeptidase [Paenibacillus alkaliterrae]